MRAVAPDPTATIEITAATPIMMPSMVSDERRRLTCRARSAIRTLARIFFIFIRPPPALPAGAQPVLRLPAAVVPRAHPPPCGHPENECFGWRKRRYPVHA